MCLNHTNPSTVEDFSFNFYDGYNEQSYIYLHYYPCINDRVGRNCSTKKEIFNASLAVELIIYEGRADKQTQLKPYRNTFKLQLRDVKKTESSVITYHKGMLNFKKRFHSENTTFEENFEH